MLFPIVTSFTTIGVENSVENDVNKKRKTFWPFPLGKNHPQIHLLFICFPHLQQQKKLSKRLENHFSTIVENNHKLLNINEILFNCYVYNCHPNVDDEITKFFLLFFSTFQRPIITNKRFL